MLEVEIKARVKNIADIREQLLLRHVSASSRVHERDVYYNAPDRDFAVTDEALRIRSNGEDYVLTYKGPKVKDYRFKAREELNTNVSSGEVTGRILERLGYRKVAEVDKWREYYDYAGASICLDEVTGLGHFVEIEAKEGREDPEKLVREIARDLGIDGDPILSSYLEMLLAVKESSLRGKPKNA